MMQYGDLTTDDFLDATSALLPPGRAFPRDPDSWQSKFFSAIAQIFWQLHQSIVVLFEREADPSQAQDLLPDYQQAYGITPRGTEDAQRAQLAAVIADPGGFTAAHYVALAAGVGITIPPPVATGPFTWEVHADGSLLPDDRAALEAVINAHNRASCSVIFIYGDGELDFSDPSNSGLDTII